MALVDVLIPAYRRKTGLAIVLAGLLGQTFTDFDVTVSDQTPEAEAFLDDLEITTLARALEYHGHRVALRRHLPARGMAEQRQFLLDQSSARYVHYLDDDVVLEPYVLERMLRTIREDACGFVGAPAAGLGYLDDVRPHQQHIELWEGPVGPEPYDPEEIWERHAVNVAANPLHLAQRLVPKDAAPTDAVRYKVVWVGGANVIYDRAKLLDVGGFSYWPRLPAVHAGEEAVVQFLLLRKYGGCGILPCGTYHLCLPTSIADRTHNATSLFHELAREHGLEDGVDEHGLEDGVDEHGLEDAPDAAAGDDAVAPALAGHRG